MPADPPRTVPRRASDSDTTVSWVYYYSDGEGGSMAAGFRHLMALPPKERALLLRPQLISSRVDEARPGGAADGSNLVTSNVSARNVGQTVGLR